MFDIGVYFCVVGLVLMVFEAFGDAAFDAVERMNVLLAAAAATLFAIGTYLVLQRKLSRIIIGIGLLSHGANLLFILSGRRGTAPLIGNGPAAGFSDPLPQALALTAIVIIVRRRPRSCWRSPTAAGCSPTTTRSRTTSTDRLVARGGFADEEVEDASDEGEALGLPGARAGSREPGRAGSGTRHLVNARC